MHEGKVRQHARPERAEKVLVGVVLQGWIYIRLRFQFRLRLKFLGCKGIHGRTQNLRVECLIRSSGAIRPSPACWCSVAVERVPRLQSRDETVELLLELGDADIGVLLVDGLAACRVGRLAGLFQAVASLTSGAVGASNAFALRLEATRARLSVGAQMAWSSSFHVVAGLFARAAPSVRFGIQRPKRGISTFSLPTSTFSTSRRRLS